MGAPEYKDISEIKETGELLTRVKFKPVPLFWIAFGVSLAMAIVGYVVPLKWIFVAGVFGIFYSMFNIFSIPDRWVCSIYDDAILFFSAEPQQRAFRVDARDIVEYNIGKNEKDYLYVRTKSGDEYKARSYRFNKITKEALQKALPGKETDEIKERRKKQ